MTRQLTESQQRYNDISDLLYEYKVANPTLARALCVYIEQIKLDQLVQLQSESKQ